MPRHIRVLSLCAVAIVALIASARTLAHGKQSSNQEAELRRSTQALLDAVAPGDVEV